MSDLRKEIRDAFFGAPIDRHSEIVEFHGRKIKIVQPRVGEFEDAMKPLRDKDGKVDNLLFGFWCVVLNCEVPETGDKIFSAHDFDTFRGFPLSYEPWQKLRDAAVAICSSKPQEDAKALGEAMPDGCSSESPK